MNDPIAFFHYDCPTGLGLPGDERGWVEYQRGWKLPCRPLQLELRAKMTEEAYILNNVQRSFVESDSGRGNWWTERGSIRWVFTDENGSA